ncbi:MAG: glycosyltransferase family 2 protein [Flavobacteriales bacterium]
MSTFITTDEPLVSIIMPAYNAAPYILEAIASVQAQSWKNWELIIVNDGSTDGTADRLDQLKDPRIKVIHQANAGVSAARNAALDKATGAFIAFLDSDDVLPPRSLEARATILQQHPEVCFADGAVLRLDAASRQLTGMFIPSFHGVPFDRLIALSSDCFFGPSWMIRRTAATDKRFPVQMRHAEDLAYYLSMARAGRYDHTAEPVLHYRQGQASAMGDLKGLEQGYAQLFAFVQELEHPPAADQLSAMRSRMRRIMFRSYLKKGMIRDAVRIRSGSFPSI